MKKIITLLFIASLILMNNKKTQAQVGIEEINFQLRDLFQHLKRPADSLPFLFEMSSHIMDEKLYRSYNDSDYISKGMFLTMYQEMRAAAYDTSILEHVDSIYKKMNSKNKSDTIDISILNTDYATFIEDAFDKDGQYYYLTDTTISDVPNRIIEPYLLKNTFIATTNNELSNFRNVVFRIDSTFVYSKSNLLSINNDDLNNSYARWKVDFSDGNGWREFNPQNTTYFNVLYNDTGLYNVSIAIFYCDPFPYCNPYPSKLSITNVYVINNSISKLPDIEYQFSNITVGLYKGCGETKNGVYIPQKPLIIVEGIDLLNNRSIPLLYEENVKTTSSKKLGLLSEYNYDFYIVNFENTHLDMRENAKGIIELIDYLKSIMTTNEQFVVFAESMGGIIARYALTYMENDAYTKDPASNKPLQMHNTRLYISNDAPHQGATVPISFQKFYRNITNSSGFKIINRIKYLIPMINESEDWNDLLSSQSIQQLLAYHIDADGPHQKRIEFMNDLIALNPHNNGYPSYCKLMAFTDGLLSGQEQINLRNKVINPGDPLFKLSFNVNLIVNKKYKFQILNFNSYFNSVNMDNPSSPILSYRYTTTHLNFRGCLRKFFRNGLAGVMYCAVRYKNESKDYYATNISSNYDTEAASIFSIMSVLSGNLGNQHLYFDPLLINSYVDVNTGEMKITALSSKYNPNIRKKAWEISLSLNTSSIGFAFIPVHSAIDFDYYKTLRLRTNYNLLNDNVQDFLLKHSPFHVICGFNYRGSNYPLNASEFHNSKNWSHGFINNREIYGFKDQFFLNREIGDHSIYLNNLNLNIRNADFSANEVYIGIHNPHHCYDFTSSNPDDINFIYSKKLNFEMIEPSIVNINYDKATYDGAYKNTLGTIYLIKHNIKPCGVTHKRTTKFNQLDLIESIPNPFNDYIEIKNLKNEISYTIQIKDLFGKIIYTDKLNEYENKVDYKINTQDLDSFKQYILIIKSKGEVIKLNKILKLN